MIWKSYITKLFIFVFLVIGISNIYAATMCWNDIACSGDIMTNGDILTYEPEIEITCVIKDITYDGSSMRMVEIEILQPGYNGATLRQNIYVDDAFLNYNGSDIYFTMGRAMSPTYINCYNVITNHNGELIRTNSMRQFNLSFGNTWYSTIDPHPNSNMWLSTNLVDNASGKKFAVNNSGTISSMIEETATQQKNNDNRILLILFGILVCVLSVGIYILTYKKGYKIIGIGIWFSLSLFSLVILNDPYRLLSLIGIFFSIYLMIIWIKENAISIMKGKKDKI